MAVSLNIFAALHGMLRMKTALIGFVLLWLVVPGALAQQVQFSSKASNTNVAAGEPFQIQFTIDNAQNISGFQPPEFHGFSILSQSQSNSTSIINGQMSQSISFIFILSAPSVGTYTIAGAKARINGTTMMSNPLTIHVGSSGSSRSGNHPIPSPMGPGNVPGSGLQQELNNNPGILKQGENARDKIKQNVFVHVDVDHKEVYVGQQLTATYKLYTRLPTSSKVTKVPSFSGFSAHDINLPNPPQATTEQFNGKTFKVFTIRKTMLFPLQSGTLQLDPVEIDNTVRMYQVTKHKNSNDPFSDMFNDPFFKDPFGNNPLFDDPFDNNVTYQDYTYNITSTPIAIHVKPLPDKGKPANFTGAVGQYSISASLDKPTLSTSDAGTLTITLKGTGNISLLNAPVVSFPNSFETYDPKISDSISDQSNPYGGSRSFKYVFMPHIAGSYTIPPISYAYFDPQSGTYKTAETNPVHLTVTPGSHTSGTSGLGSSSLIQNNTLAPIVTGSISWKKSDTSWLSGFWYWALLILPLLFLGLVAGVKKYVTTSSSDSLTSKKKKATKVALARLSTARELLSQQNGKAFYEEVSHAIWGYLCDKLDIAYAELNRDKVKKGLETKKVNPEDLRRLFTLLDSCELALYAGAINLKDMHSSYDTAIQLISDLENQMKF